MRRVFLFLVITSFVLLAPVFSFAYKGRDTLEKKFTSQADPVKRAFAAVDLVRSYGPNYDSLELKGNYLAKEFLKEKNRFGEMLMYFTMCRSGVEFAKYEASREYGQKTISHARSQQNDSIVARTWLSIGFSYYSQGDFQMGIGSYLKVLPLCEKHSKETNYRKIMASGYNGLGLCFSVKPYPNNDKALDYYLKALKIDEETHNTRDWGLVLVRLGILYTGAKDYKKAEDYLNQAIAFANKAQVPMLVKWSTESMATLHRNRNNFKEALKNYKTSLQISKATSEIPGIMSSYINISETYIGMKDDRLALIYLDSAYALGAKNKVFEPLFKIHALRSDIFSSKNDFAKALEYHKRSVEIKDSLLSERSNDNIQEIETRYKTQIQEKQLNEKTAELQIQTEKSERQAAQRNVFIAGILLLLVVIVLVYRQNRLKNRANEIIRSQKLLVELKNKDITDSMNYAKRIQDAILPPRELRTQIFPDSFVMFEPRDIVSGDFYWYTLKNGKKIIAAVDCTGHSVPGAFMSMIGNAFLNEIVNEKGVTQPGLILDMLKERVVMSLKQSENDNKDGMDMAIIAIDDTAHTMEFAGANNPCWHLRNGVLTEIKGDKQPIAYQAKGTKPFTNHTMQLQSGDCLYIFTDGYADQFGGEHGKKFKYKPLKELITGISHMPFTGQLAIVKRTFDTWKGNHDQIDDVCVIGLRF